MSSQLAEDTLESVDKHVPNAEKDAMEGFGREPAKRKLVVGRYSLGLPPILMLIRG
jgi:hypothetical protein